MSETLSVKVIRKADEAENICSLRLEAVAPGTLQAFSAGAHIDVHLPNGIVRQYSLVNAGNEPYYDIAVLNEAESRGGSRAIHEAVREGDVLTISAPRNHFALTDTANHSLLLAGGIGVTPILCMAQRLSAIGAPFEMHYCVRNIARAAFVERIAELPFASQVTMHYDDGPADETFNMAATIAAQPAGTHLYVCGPAGFIEAATSIAKARGWPADHVHFEYFAAGPTDRADDGSFEVQVASSGKIFTVPPAVSALQVLNDAGIDIPWSCEEGVCGTCVTRLLDGVPDHRDHFLSDAEKAAGDIFTPCCSRARSARLVLDL